MADARELARELGFSRSAWMDLSLLRVYPEVREMCAAGRCQRYEHSWSCPPACGSLEHCARRMAAYDRGLLVQTSAQLEDDFDAEGIAAAQSLHKRHFETLVRQIRQFMPDCLPLTAGSCTLCRRCTYPERPCRFPGKRLSSMEAYGLLVSEVCQQAGLPYYYGPKTITYSSCILMKEGIQA